MCSRMFDVRSLSSHGRTFGYKLLHRQWLRRPNCRDARAARREWMRACSPPSWHREEGTNRRVDGAHDKFGTSLCGEITPSRHHLFGNIPMTTLQEFRCEVCGIVTSDPIHWFVIRCGDSELTVHRWNSGAANATGARHYCGEAHAEVYISRWFDSVCVPPRPDFNRPSPGTS
jgi:hypothetical protein